MVAPRKGVIFMWVKLPSVMGLAVAAATLGIVPNQVVVGAEEAASPISSYQSAATDHIANLQGSDGKVREVRTASRNGVQGRELSLLDGDELKVSEDGSVVSLYNGDGIIVGTFESPELEDEKGNSIDARFSTYENFLLVIEDGVSNRSGCGKATAGKWVYRVGAAGVCTAASLGMGPLGGAGCSLGAAAFEDEIPFDNVC